MAYSSFFFNDTATTEIYTLSLHDALPISCILNEARGKVIWCKKDPDSKFHLRLNQCSSECSLFHQTSVCSKWRVVARSEEHTSELQSRQYLVCRLLLEKKKQDL